MKEKDFYVILLTNFYHTWMCRIKKSCVWLAALVFACASCVKDGDSEAYEIINHVEVGDAVPEFTVSDGAGSTFHSSDFIGKRSLLILFSTECPDCQKVLPIINDEVWPQIKDDPAYQLVTISRDETAEVVNKFWSDKKFTLPTYLDPGRKVFDLFANSTVPRLYIINVEGKIDWMAIEYLEITAEALTAKIRAAQ